MPIGSIVVLLCGLYLGPQKVIPELLGSTVLGSFLLGP